MAALHPQLEKDGISIGRLELCRVLLMNDANFPWCILVPDRDDITEIYQLTADDQILLIKESTLLARCMVQLFSPDKLNVAALGNLVPQLHIHHIARFRHDPAWPAPVWGHTPAKAYSIAEAARLKQQLNTCLREALPPPA
jgi:diadenosine tetraphosphate (Ap4A) HIT family hydrolase